MFNPISYITNSEKQVEAVVIDIKDWQKIQEQLKAFEQHSTFRKDLETAFAEVKQFQKGTKKARKLKDILKEL